MLRPAPPALGAQRARAITANARSRSIGGLKESTRTFALAALGLLGAGLGGVIYLGVSPGPASRGTTAAGTTTSATTSTEGSASAGSGSSVPAAPPAASGPPRFVASPDLSPAEQVVLERLNQVRVDPPSFLPAWRALLVKHARSLECKEPASMLDPLAAYHPRQPLAANQQLTDAARAHARDQLARQFFAHVNPDGTGPNQRVIRAGYPLPVDRVLVGTAIYSAAEDGANIESLHLLRHRPPRLPTGEAWRESIDGLIIDACVPSRGHRDHLLSSSALRASELEIGVGGVTGTVTREGKDESQLYVTIEIAMRANDTRFVTGVAYRDADRNGAYDLGEGVPDVEVTIAAAGVFTKTGPGGGYTLPVPNGLVGEIAAAGATASITVNETNVKFDVVVP